jgi:hypothetical protein
MKTQYISDQNLSQYTTTQETYNNTLLYQPPLHHESRAAYERIYNEICLRYQDFDPSTEIGFGGQTGLTANIQNIELEDLIGAMMHIRDDNALFKACREQSRSSRLFDKFYLMRHPEQHWNLRLHLMHASGNGLNEEDSPHYHRWTLASRMLTGGYCNRNYQEMAATDVDPLHRYDKCQLTASNSQTSDRYRTVHIEGQVGMIPTQATIFERGRLNHFPVHEAHSIQTKPSLFGSTLTLAHSSAPVSEHSYAFLKPHPSGGHQTELDTIKSTQDPDFLMKFERSIAWLQILSLQDQLRTHFEHCWEQSKKLTHHEHQHQYDSYEPNYVETSLLSAIQLYLMEKEHGLKHQEFSGSTAKLLDKALEKIKPTALEQLIRFNQHDLERMTFSVDHMPDHNTLMKQMDHEFMQILRKPQTNKHTQC